MNGEIFLVYLQQCLVPTLDPGDIVIADNLLAHKVPGARKATEAAGATLHFLPCYSLDLDQIELPFAKFKALLRKAAERSITRLQSRIASLIPTFGARECANYLRHAGYAAT